MGEERHGRTLRLEGRGRGGPRKKPLGGGWQSPLSTKKPKMKSGLVEEIASRSM